MPRHLHLVPAVLVAAAVVLPTGVAGAQDLRSPDARAAAVQPSGMTWNDLRSPDSRTASAPVVSSTSVDLRSPDARAASAPVVTATRVDLRSPDAVDGDSGSRRGITVDPAVIRVSVPAVSTGFQWDDAGIGAGILFALLVLSAGGYALMAAHRRSAGGTPLAH